MPVNRSHRRDKLTFEELICDYDCFEYEIILSDLYLALIIEHKLSLMDAVRMFKLHDKVLINQV